MCIIAAKAAGVSMPPRETIRHMWDVNHDGAGIMYLDKGQVHIEKGFMKYKDFTKALDRLEKKLDLTATPVVMHFRITTHGGTNPENTHPFPITDSIGALKKLNITTDVGVAHNGIINAVSPRKGLSDTAEYVAMQLAPLKKALPRFYENKHAMLLIQNAIESKMAFLTRNGKIYTIGDFVEDEGVLYSNESYKGYSLFRSPNVGCYGYGWYDDWGYDYATANKSKNKGASKDTPPFEDDTVDTDYLMYLDDGDYVIFPDGEMFDGFSFLLNESGVVFEYDWDKDVAVPVLGATAYSSAGVPLRFDEELAEPVFVAL